MLTKSIHHIVRIEFEKFKSFRLLSACPSDTSHLAAPRGITPFSRPSIKVLASGTGEMAKTIIGNKLIEDRIT